MCVLTVLVLVFVVYNRRREAQIKYPNPDDDVRENIINYEDEGGGEDDMTAFDITPLQIPVATGDPGAAVTGGHPHPLGTATLPHPGHHHPHHPAHHQALAAAGAHHSLPRQKMSASSCEYIFSSSSTRVLKA